MYRVYITSLRALHCLFIECNLTAYIYVNVNLTVFFFPQVSTLTIAGALTLPVD